MKRQTIKNIVKGARGVLLSAVGALSFGGLTMLLLLMGGSDIHSTYYWTISSALFGAVAVHLDKMNNND